MMTRNAMVGSGLGVALALALWCGPAAAESAATNRFADPSFEAGERPWSVSAADGTVCRFDIDSTDAVHGERSALLTIEAAEDWGAQFGQQVEPGRTGETWTFAAYVKSLGGPLDVSLEIERSADPWDRAAQADFGLGPDKWTELHVTFTVEKAFPEGWFAYVGCQQAGARLRVDAFRLYEGDYVPLQQAPRPELLLPVRLFDTGAPIGRPLPPDALARVADWVELGVDQVAREISGDAVMSNDRLVVALRRGVAGAEVYAMTPAGMVPRAVLAPRAEGAALAATRVLEREPTGAALEADFDTPDGQRTTLVYRLGLGQPFVETEARPGAEALRVEAPCRFAVLPDFFADDIVVDAATLPVDRADLPGENFLLHMLEGQGAILMAVWTSNDRDVAVSLVGTGAGRQLRASEVPYGEAGKVWVALIEAPAVWHVRDVATADQNRTIALDWQMPFPAQWRVDWTKADGLTDSWEMVMQSSNGAFVKQGWFGGASTLPADRKRWTTVLGWFQYPCWTDTAGRGYLQPLGRAVRFDGPALIYPINRIPSTPLDAYTVVDVVRMTLGVGPCEYILDVEGQRQEYKGIATCANRDTLNPIYASGEQRQKRDVVERCLRDVMIFVQHIRGRVNDYVAFGHEIREYLAAQKEAHPDLADRLHELDRLARAIEERADARREAIKTPEYAAKLVEQFRAEMLDYEGPDALERCKEFTEALVEVGGNQDELVGECRMAVKILRQRAGLMVARDPRLGEVARQIRDRSQEVLRNPAGHEGARH
ncbi:MAG: hypothetical protein AMK73_04565 [Planctomycetes bacterium SM23_32]|nr:MAG: hypothetical protein AMK73_04565 [Planctomycetes bacterium SM23_32]